MGNSADHLEGGSLMKTWERRKVLGFWGEMKAVRRSRRGPRRRHLVLDAHGALAPPPALSELARADVDVDAPMPSSSLRGAPPPASLASQGSEDVAYPN
ncbi:hypothetical protein EYF80_038019 [Liparis tanakae]|uniref:Uncharacterized protein n=1 Tax=Liparis tanakae TaxID=230148 RepID=A0A4Z2GEY9_9TELE|nr:hypothetical protein EYF80_038019 [Liparis tanakae]